MRLFTPVWLSGIDKDKALKAVEKETNQKKLAEIAEKASIFAVRVAAAEKLTDRAEADSMYSRIAKDMTYCEDYRLEAINRISDYRTLLETAKNVGDRYSGSFEMNLCHRRLREAAIQRIVETADQSFLIDRARNDDDSNVRVKLIQRVNDQGVLAGMAKNDVDYESGKAAADKLTDPEALADVAQHAKRNDIRMIACRKLGHHWKGCVCSYCGETQHNYVDIEGESCKRRCSFCGREDSFHNFKETVETNDSWYKVVQTVKCTNCGAPNPDFKMSKSR